MPTESSAVLDTASSSKPGVPPEPSTGPKRYRFSIDEAYAISETGIFRGKRMELIGGQFLVKEPPSSFHAGMVNRLLNRLERMVGPNAIVSAQNPVLLSPFDVPQPDIALLKPQDDFYASEHPGPDDVYLVVEVSNTSLRYDQSTKASLYAAAGIETYWIVDVHAETVSVHTNPSEKTYRDVETYSHGDTLALPVSNAPNLPTAELFPEPEQDAEDTA